jgi:hypothetical protein
MQNRRPGVRLEDLLLRHGAISQEQLARAKEEQKKWGGDLGRIFVDLGFISEELLMRALAHSLGTHFCDPATEPLDPQIVRSIGVQVCERFGIIPVAGELNKKMLRIASSDPGNAEALEELMRLTGYKMEAYTATGNSIGVAIRRYFYGESTGHNEAPTAPGGYPAAPAAPAPAAAAARPAAAHPAQLPPSAASILAPTPPPVGAPPAVAAPANPIAAPAPAAVAAAALPPVTPAEIEALNLRVSRLEAYLAAVKRDLSTEISSNPQIAGLAGRLEQLEQLAQNDVGSLRAVVELLLERGVFKLDELAAKVKQVRTR